MSTLILKKIFKDFRSFLIVCLILFAGFVWAKGKLEMRSMKRDLAEFHKDLNGKFEQLENGAAKAERDGFLRYSSLYDMLNDVPASIKKRIEITDEQLKKIAKFIAESDTFKGGGEITLIDSNLAIFDDSIQTISVIGNPVSVDYVEYFLKPMKYEGGFVITKDNDYIWLKNLTLGQDIKITDFKTFDHRSFWQKWRYSIGFYGNVDWFDKDVSGSLGPRIALGYNKWLIQVKKPAVSIRNDEASVELFNTKSWEFEINRDFWFK